MQERGIAVVCARLGSSPTATAYVPCCILPATPSGAPHITMHYLPCISVPLCFSNIPNSSTTVLALDQLLGLGHELACVEKTQLLSLPQPLVLITRQLLVTCLRSLQGNRFSALLSSSDQGELSSSPLCTVAPGVTPVIALPQAYRDRACSHASVATALWGRLVFF